MKKFKILLHDYIIVIALLAFSVLYIKFSTESVSAEPSNIEIESPKEDSIIILRDSLTEWQVFIMALIEVECERNPKAKSPGGAVGPFQITQSYISEINRVYKTNFILSNSDVKGKDENDNFFDEIYNEYHIQRVMATRMVNANPEKRGKLSELMISNISMNYR